MAKKKVEEPVYVKAPLKISRERFTELLSKQIQEGEELLKIEVPKKANRPISYGNMYDFGMTRKTDTVEYDDASKSAFMSQYKMWDDYNTEIYQSSFTFANNTYWHQYEQQSWNHFYSHDIVADYKKQIERQITQMKSDIKKVDLIECETAVYDVSNNTMNVENKFNDKKQVFVVYGHDQELKLSVEAFLKDELGLDVVALDEKPNLGKTIIEKFEHFSKDAGFAVILMSPDDEMNVDGKIYKQARQNVVLESGYFMAKLGRERVCVVLRGDVEKPSDISGILHLPYEGNWKYELIKELKAIGVLKYS